MGHHQGPNEQDGEQLHSLHDSDLHRIDAFSVAGQCKTEFSFS